MNTDPHDLPDWRLLDAWLAGSATPAEKAEVEAWMRQDSRNAVFVRELEAAIRQPAPATDLDRAWKATMEKAKAREGERVMVLKRVRPARFAPALAAGIVMVAALGVLLTRSPRTIEVATAAGQQVTRALEDGSRVTLNANSRLRYPRHFGNDRQVELEGEGFFEVTHDAARPFHVRAGSGIVTDLGTRFVVRAYRDMAGLRVGVSEGSVSLRHEQARDSVILTEGMVGRLDGSGVAVVDRATDLRVLYAWTNGSLIFSATPLPEVAAELARRFAVVVRVDDSLSARRLTGAFQRETLEQILGAMDVSLGIRHDRAGDTVRLRPAGAPR
jgi:transmembrane sensor